MSMGGLQAHTKLSTQSVHVRLRRFLPRYGESGLAVAECGRLGAVGQVRDAGRERLHPYRFLPPWPDGVTAGLRMGTMAPFVASAAAAAVARLRTSCCMYCTNSWI